MKGAVAPPVDDGMGGVVVGEGGCIGGGGGSWTRRLCLQRVVELSAFVPASDSCPGLDTRPQAEGGVAEC